MESLENAYQIGLLTLKHKTLNEMDKHGLLPCSIKHACRLLSKDIHADKTGLQKRLKTAPKNTYLAVDIFVSKHQGWKIEGLDKYYSTSDKGTVWGLGFAGLQYLLFAAKTKEANKTHTEAFAAGYDCAQEEMSNLTLQIDALDLNE